METQKGEVQILGDGREAFATQLHESSLELERLHNQLETITSERDKLKEQNTALHRNAEQPELKDVLQEKEKMIVALKKKIKELRKSAKAQKEITENEAASFLKRDIVDSPVVVKETIQMTQAEVVEASFDNMSTPSTPVSPTGKSVFGADYAKLKDEVEHLRHERNVYEESYISLQRDLDQTEKENEVLRGDVGAKEDEIRELESKLEDTLASLKKDWERKMKETEKALAEHHGKEYSEVETLAERLRLENTEMEKKVEQVDEEKMILAKENEELTEKSSEMRTNLDSTMAELKKAQEELESVKVRCALNISSAPSADQGWISIAGIFFSKKIHFQVFSIIPDQFLKLIVFNLNIFRLPLFQNFSNRKSEKLRSQIKFSEYNIYRYSSFSDFTYFTASEKASQATQRFSPRNCSQLFTFLNCNHIFPGEVW